MNNGYKSPARKLVSFFKSSRDSWKEKFQDLKIKHRNLERRHEYASDKINGLKEEVRQLRFKISPKTEDIKKNLNHLKVSTFPKKASSH